MVRAKVLNFLLLLSIFLYSFLPRFCTAQGNTSNSSNTCETYGKCGPFGSCNSQVSPICTCLRGFYPTNNQEWSSGNWTSGCVRRVPLNCEGNNGTSNGSGEDGFLKLQKMKISGYSARWFGPEDQCQDRCLRNCSCIAYGFDVGIGCMFWSPPLIDVQVFPGGSGSDLYIRVANSELASKKDTKKTIIIVVVVGLVVVSICAYFSWKWIAKRRGKRKTSEPEIAGKSGSVDSFVQDALSQVNHEELPLFKFEILANATNRFDEANKLGKGGFGPVYKGTLPGGQQIAVKRLSRKSGQGLEEFKNEIMLIAKLQHRNLVRLLGCCIEGEEKMLLYEYMPNKSLDSYLFEKDKSSMLDWERRFNIICGIARGLLYLHQDSRFRIIHRDLKASNILLDKEMNPKISDFGMARIFGGDQTEANTKRVVGTYGYMSPEYAMDGLFSIKSDVFSFGVLVLEIVSGTKNRGFYQTNNHLNLLAYAWKLYREGRGLELMDTAAGESYSASEVMRCIQVGLLCVQEHAEDRPNMSTVVLMLSSDFVSMPQPKHPGYCLGRRPADTDSFSSKPDESCTVNQVTVTMLDGR
ncbi:UNVERIFIED_CONTAM: G-type lectin S-receptor-like serine/threonine-protein kinase [Sesamum indicum]